MTAHHKFSSSAEKALRAYDEVRGEIEATFEIAGSSLETALDGLNGLGPTFDALQEGLSPEVEARLTRRIGRVKDRLEHLQEHCHGFSKVSDSLRGSVRSISSEVHELDRVVRTIANISVNARIQGNSLNPIRPQVTAFVDRLAQMSEESETILTEINNSMGEIAQDVSSMELEQADMLRELKQKFIPSITAFSAVSERMRDGRAGLISAATDLSSQTRAIASEVGGLIVALQIGDFTRQRIERVEDALHQIPQVSPANRGRLADLAQALSAETTGTAHSEISVALQKLQVVYERGQAALLTAGSSGLVGGAFDRGSNRRDDRAVFEESLQGNEKHFAALKLRADTVHRRISVILKHEETLRTVAHHIRLSGINAVIICAKLGREGRALRELAHWLRDLTDESDTIVARLQSILAEARETIRKLTEEQIGGLEETISGFADDGQVLSQLIGMATDLVQKTREEFDDTSSSLDKGLKRAMNELRVISQHLDGLEESAASLASYHIAPAATPDDDAAILPVLEKLFKRYTMQSERDVHNRLFAKLGEDGGAEEAAPAAKAEAPAEPAAAGGDDDLDDILF